jgi:hypothetical protein
MAGTQLVTTIFPWTESDSHQEGFILSVRHPYTGERGQGFYRSYDEAVLACHRAINRFNRWGNPLEYLDTPYVPEPQA